MLAVSLRPASLEPLGSLGQEQRQPLAGAHVQHGIALEQAVHEAKQEPANFQCRRIAKALL